jgi:glycosyltransferase involved in cell wall biosynthesis
MRRSHEDKLPSLASGKVSILLPAFNEAKQIVKNLRETVETFYDMHADFEVILIDDGSHDSTYLHAIRVLSEHPEFVRVVRYDCNQGKGNALMTGAACARGEFVVFMDADMELHPSQLPLFFAIMDATGADAVIGSKHHRASDVAYPIHRRFLSLAYYSFVRLLFGLPLRDTQTGLKLFRRQVLDDVFPRVLAKRFAFDIELLAVAHHLGYKLVDAPVKLDFRRSLSRIRFRDVRNMFLDTLAIFYRLRIRKYYDSSAATESAAVLPDHREISLDEASDLLKH